MGEQEVYIQSFIHFLSALASSFQPSTCISFIELVNYSPQEPFNHLRFFNLSESQQGRVIGVCTLQGKACTK